MTLLGIAIGLLYGWIINPVKFVDTTPASASLYTIQSGDTLKIIAARYGTTLNNLLTLNPQIWNADWIYAGQVIRVW